MLDILLGLTSPPKPVGARRVQLESMEAPVQGAPLRPRHPRSPRPKVTPATQTRHQQRLDDIAAFVTARGPVIFETIRTHFAIDRASLYRDLRLLVEAGRISRGERPVCCWGPPGLAMRPSRRNGKNLNYDVLIPAVLTREWMKTRQVVGALMHHGVQFSSVIRALYRLRGEGRIEGKKDGRGATWRLR